MESAELAIVAMAVDGRAWDCDMRVLGRLRAERGSPQRTTRSCVVALRGAEATLTEMVRDRRATPSDCTALMEIRQAIR